MNTLLNAEMNCLKELEMNNEPVAWMLNGIIHECDPSDWAKEQYPDQDVIPLYTHPVKELNNGGEPVKNATYWKRQYNLMATQNDNLKSGLYHANEQIKYLESHPVEEQDTECKYCKQGCIRCDARKQLTDEEINEVIRIEASKDPAGIGWNLAFNVARAILRKAQEK